MNSSETEYVLKKGGSEVQILPCNGWFDPCEYCDKRFCDWVPVREEVYKKIPQEPGFFIIALKDKNGTEVVSILFDESNIQKKAITELDAIKDQISNKKSKATKSIILVRWMVIKEVDDKENSILCAHWENNGVLPKFMTTWPGKNLMEESDAVEFVKEIQKWCYPQKFPIWRKTKRPCSKILQEVEKCNLHSCEICDSYFTPWRSLSDVIEKKLAPCASGLLMLSVVYEKNREVILIPSNVHSVVLPIRCTIRSYEKNEKCYLKNPKFKNKNPSLEVRWMLVNDVDCDNLCFLYAHWLNADKWPEHNNHTHLPLPGEISLNKNKHFVYRTNDEKWFYGIEALKQTKFSRPKNRRRLSEELAERDYKETKES